METMPIYQIDNVTPSPTDGHLDTLGWQMAILTGCDIDEAIILYRIAVKLGDLRSRIKKLDRDDEIFGILEGELWEIVHLLRQL